MVRASSRAVRVGVIMFEITGVAIAVVAAATVLLYWRLQSGPVSLALFEASAEYAVRQSLPPGHHIDIRSASLAKAGAAGAYDLVLEKVIISDPKGDPVADLSAIEFEFRARDVVRGRFGPHRIAINDAALTVERGPDRSITLEEGPESEKRNLFRALTGGERFRRTLDHAELRNARIRFHDAISDRAWLAEHAGARLDRKDYGYRAQIEGAFKVDGEEASLDVVADYSDRTGVIDTVVDVEKAPVGDILETLYGAKAAILSGPVTGRLSMKMSRAGSILSSRIDAHVGAGVLRVGSYAAEIEFVDLKTTFDPDTNSFDVATLAVSAGGSHGAISGAVSIDLDSASITPGRIRFDLEGKEFLIDAENLFEAPLSIDSVSVAGAYNVAEHRFSADHLAVSLLDVEIAGALQIAPKAGKSPEVKVQLNVDGALDPQRILAGWPVSLSPNARTFVANRLPAARVDNVTFEVDLPAGALVAGAPTPDEAWALAFDIREATAFYSPRMTPLKNGSGKARLTGNRFFIDQVKGSVGAVSVREGEVEFTALSPAGEPVYYRFTADGEVSDILEIINEEPLALLKRTDLSPSRFVGRGTVRTEIMRPNRSEVPRNKYGYLGEAKFGDLTLVEFFGGADLSAARGTVTFDSRSMKVKANAALGDSPVKIEWRNNFYAEDGPSRFHVTGEVDSSTGDVFGIPTRQLLRGPVQFTADALGDLGGVDDLTVSADFTNTALTFDAFGWRKLSEVEATGALELAFEKGGIEVRAFELEGEDMEIRAKARFASDGVVEKIDIEHFFLEGGADFSATAARTESGLLDVTLTGQLLNAANLIKATVESGGRSGDGGPEDWGAGAILRGRIYEVRARGGAVYHDATLDFRRGRERMEALEFSARTEGGKPLSVVLKDTGTEAGPRQVVEARTDDIGALLSGLFAISSVKDGEGYMELLTGEAGAGGIAGMLEARNLRVIKAPLLARVFAAGSLDGLADLLNGEGISLTKAFGRFEFEKGVVSIKEARATGPSVGITGAGRIDAREGGVVSLSGAIAPAYQVNALLGKTPIIGDILVSREGEGVLALSYAVAGPSDAPTATVNPLSALTPGVLRRMFEWREPAPAAEAAPADATPQPDKPTAAEEPSDEPR